MFFITTVRPVIPYGRITPFHFHHKRAHFKLAPEFPCGVEVGWGESDGVGLAAGGPPDRSC